MKNYLRHDFLVKDDLGLRRSELPRLTVREVCRDYVGLGGFGDSVVLDMNAAAFGSNS